MWQVVVQLGDVVEHSLAQVALAFVGSVALYVRRLKEGGELGGKSGNQMISSVFFFGLWVVYISANAVYLSKFGLTLSKDGFCLTV